MPYKPYSAAHKKAAKADIVSYFKGPKKKKAAPSPIMAAMQKRVARSKPKAKPAKPAKRRKLFSSTHGFKFGG